MPAQRKDEAITPRRVRTAADVGDVVKKSRRRTSTDQSTAAGLLGVGVRFLGDLERGKPTARLGLVLQVLDGLGLEIWIGPRGWRHEP